MSQITIGFETGHQVLQAERAVLGFLRGCGATDRLPQREMPQGGYTETVARADPVDLASDLLAAIAQAAGRIVLGSNCPLHQYVRDVWAAVDAVHELTDSGYEKLAIGHLETVLELVQERIRRLKSSEREDVPLSS
ncbi:hypothetical protein ACFXG6_31825 [Streptomyces roseus]|uniref:hypothetical protein n=1 Tax=Streptomyces roseus TaxID=66430 RepID=UPI0036A22276